MTGAVHTAAYRGSPTFSNSTPNERATARCSSRGIAHFSGSWYQRNSCKPRRLTTCSPVPQVSDPNAASAFPAVSGSVTAMPVRAASTVASPVSNRCGVPVHVVAVPQHCLYFRPEPHQHRWFRPGGHAITPGSRRRARSAQYDARVGPVAGSSPRSWHQAR